MTTTAVRVGLSLVFLLTAIAKSRAGLDNLSETLSRYALIPAGHGRLAAILLVTLEAAAGLLLITPWSTIGAGLGVLLAGGFVSAVSSSLARGESFACGCFGPALPLRVSAWLLGGDLVMLGSALFLLGEPLTAGWGAPWQRLTVVVLSLLVLGGGAQAARVAFLPVPAGLPRGAPAPRLVVRNASAQALHIDRLASEGLVLVFVTTDCPRRIGLLRSLAGARRPSVPVLLVGPRSLRVLRTLVDRYGCASEWTIGGEDARRLRRRFRIPGSPAVVALAGGRVVGTVFPADRATVEGAARQVERFTAELGMADDSRAGALPRSR